MMPADVKMGEQTLQPIGKSNFQINEIKFERDNNNLLGLEKRKLEKI